MRHEVRFELLLCTYHFTNRLRPVVNEISIEIIYTRFLVFSIPYGSILNRPSQYAIIRCVSKLKISRLTCLLLPIFIQKNRSGIKPLKGDDIILQNSVPPSSTVLYQNRYSPPVFRDTSPVFVRFDNGNLPLFSICHASELPSRYLLQMNSFLPAIHHMDQES